ncbi:3'-5' exonuclease [Streptomyces xiamenensis]|uniref:3'-5' exonuclease n=1 Tax=Streptomyces xiamenensis TaxID=408015 RepID=UPI0037D1FE93
MSWTDQPMAGFDLETTGVSVEDDRVVTACVARVGRGLTTAPVTWLADPGIDIPEGAAAVHGVTTERARAEGRPAAEVVGEIVASLAEVVADGLPIVAMNASYDLTLLDREARRHGVTPLVDEIGGPDRLRVIDPRVLDKRIDQFRRGSRTLTALCAHYGVRLDGAHSSDADALAACRVAWRIGQISPGLAATDLAVLHEQQIAWAAEQADSLADYFRSRGRVQDAAGVRRDWPLIPAQRTA